MSIGPLPVPSDGLIVICKEAGWTSFDVVAKLRRILGTKKVGHTGTLDPEAEGVLPVAFGRGTKLIELFGDHDKEYLVRLRLGVSTDTQDMTGTVLREREVSVSEEEVRSAALSFVGEQEQIPPMYSALKVGGKRLYELARAGEVVERRARRVTFHAITVTEVNLPEAEMLVSCSKGTYIRTLCHDLGEKLGCGAAMVSLLRTRSGDFTLERAHLLSEVEEAAKEGRLSDWIYGLDDLLASYPRVLVWPEHDKLLRNGNPIPAEGYEAAREGECRMCLSTGELMGLYGYRAEENDYFPLKMFGV